MSKRVWRASLVGIPLIAVGMAAIAACSDDDADGGGGGTINVPVIDASLDTADGSKGTDPKIDAAPPSSDAGADVEIPPFCQTYSNNGLEPDAASGEGTDPIPRWDLIAYRALEAAAVTCEVGGAFADNFGDPTAYECLGKQLAGITGCAGTVDYSGASDSNGTFCAPDAGSVIQLGFRDPGVVHYTLKDVDYFITLLGKAAASTGIPSVDVARLMTLLQAVRTNVVGTDGLDAGPDGGDFSQSTCP